MKIKLNILRIFKPNNPESVRHLEQMWILFEQVWKFLSRSIISNFLKHLHLIKSILNVTGPYQKVFSIKIVSYITPLIQNNQFVDFKEKSESFNTFFANQCTHIETESNLPT